MEGEKLESKPCATKYDIMLPDIRATIKESLNTLEGSVEITNNPKTNIDYRSKIIRNGSSLTLTQWDNGTLLLQGKTDKLFHDCCDLIEQVANPSDREIIARFISSDEEALNRIVTKCTPQLIDLAEESVKEKLGEVYDYLEPHDQKLFIASGCLCLAGIPLPEYSALVMPASKAFEGFAKKLLVDVGLVKADYFKEKNANFSALSNPTDQRRKTICEKERHADTMLKQVELTLKKSRHFMMHSDESRITKVDSQKAAEEKVNDISKDTKGIFDYFNEIYGLLPS